MSKTWENLPDFAELVNAVGLLGMVSGDIRPDSAVSATLPGFRLTPNSSETAGSSGQSRGRRG